jgi:entericidin B
MNPIVISKIASTHASKLNRIFLCGFAFMVTAALALSTTSCATSKGFGRDVQKVGDKIENAADRTGGAR